MTCREFADFIMDYLDGELDERLRTDFDQHLAVCANCATYLAQYRETVAAGRLAFDDENAPLPREVPDDLVRAILASRKR
jgi:anti-sigma factor RsiW